MRSNGAASDGSKPRSDGPGVLAFHVVVGADQHEAAHGVFEPASVSLRLGQAPAQDATHRTAVVGVEAGGQPVIAQPSSRPSDAGAATETLQRPGVLVLHLVSVADLQALADAGAMFS